MVEPLSTTQDFNWITRRYPELQRKYPSQYVAIRNRRVIAHGHDAGKVYLKAKRGVKKDFVTAYILSGDPFVLNALLRNLSRPSLREKRQSPQERPSDWSLEQDMSTASQPCSRQNRAGLAHSK